MLRAAEMGYTFSATTPTLINQHLPLLEEHYKTSKDRNVFALPIGNLVCSKELVLCTSHDLSTVWTVSLLHWLFTLSKIKATVNDKCYKIYWTVVEVTSSV